MPYSKNVALRLEAATKQVEDLIVVHQYMESGSPKEVSDHILRAALTMTVSAIDTFIHELLVSSVMFELKEDRKVFDLSEVVVDAIVYQEDNSMERLSKLESSLRRQYSKLTYQSSRNIESALSSVGITRVWTRLSVHMSKKPEKIKTQLDLIARRRNQIVHEGDLDYLHNPQDINACDVKESLRFIRSLAEGVILIFEDMTKPISGTT